MKRNVYWIDLFCGAGGTTTGIHMAKANAKVIACVNHDIQAIKDHMANHPDCLHFTEDIRDWSVIIRLRDLVADLRAKDPTCIINIWASLECTHFSKARGGMSREADSRTLANHLLLYMDEIKPDYLYIENLEEFLSWGPLDESGKAITHLRGTDYARWRESIKGRGYDYRYKMLNAADFGALTSRDRYFGVFAKKGLPIRFPSQTHIKRSKAKATGLEPWKPVRDVIDLTDTGKSLFGLTERGVPYSDNTIERAYKGLLKFFNDGLFMSPYYGSGTPSSADAPCNTITTKDRHAVHFINYDYGRATHSGIDAPAGPITTKPKHGLISAHLMDKQFGNNGRSIDEPCQTLIARMDKKPLYLVSYINGDEDHRRELPGDSEVRKKVKAFMRSNGIKDITIRMLSVKELKVIQGFPEDYKLTGTKTSQLKFIGNSVVPLIAQKLIEENYNSLIQMAA